MTSMQLGEKGVNTPNMARAHNVSQPRPISSRRADSQHVSNTGAPPKSSLAAPVRSAVPAGMQGRSLPTSPVQLSRSGSGIGSDWGRADLPAAHRQPEPISSDSDSDADAHARAKGCNGDAARAERRPVDTTDAWNGGPYNTSRNADRFFFVFHKCFICGGIAFVMFICSRVAG